MPRRFVVAVLNRAGAVNFANRVEDVDLSERLVYFVHDVHDAPLVRGRMLSGRFLFELEKDPELFRLPSFGSASRLRFPNDIWIAQYDNLTKEERECTQVRLCVLAENHPQFADPISELLEAL